MFLSLTLPAPMARKTNIVVAAVYVLVSIGNVVDETWSFIWVGAAFEAALLAIVRYAWTWPRLVSGVAGDTSPEAMQPSVR